MGERVRGGAGRGGVLAVPHRGDGGHVPGLAAVADAHGTVRGLDRQDTFAFHRRPVDGHLAVEGAGAQVGLQVRRIVKKL